jgi:hypothetical protein
MADIHAARHSTWALQRNSQENLEFHLLQILADRSPELLARTLPNSTVQFL